MCDREYLEREDCEVCPANEFCDDYQDYLFAPENITEIAEEALDEIREKIKKKFKNRYLKIAEKALLNLSTEAEPQKIEHNSLCETETYKVEDK